MAKTFLVTASMRTGRTWAYDHGKAIKDIIVITRPEEAYGYIVEAGDQIVFDLAASNRHTTRAHEVLLTSVR